MLSEDLLVSVGLYRSWVAYPYISDHAPVLLQLEITPLFKAFPFKFNSQWLREEEFAKIVHSVWKTKIFTRGRDSEKGSVEIKRIKESN
jgi:hypothetical protein